MRNREKGKPLYLRYKVVCGILFFCLPLSVLLGSGFLFLWEAHGFLPFSAFTALCFFLGWFLLSRMTTSKPITQGTLSESLHISPAEFWSEEDLKIWKKVKEMSCEFAKHENALELKDFGEAVLAILQEVSSFYHPGIRHPELEIPLSDVLHVVEQASQEVREELLARIPFETVLTIGDIKRIQKGSRYYRQAYLFYRALRAALNPMSAAISESREYLTKGAVQNVVSYSKDLLISETLEGIGKHLINLYAGYAVRGECEHVHISIIGQTSSGKSSLTSAAFEPTHVMEGKSGEEVSLCHSEAGDFFRIIDTPGYGSSHSDENAKRFLKTLSTQTDLLVLVMSATQASRTADRVILDLFLEVRPDIPVMIAVTGIDKLRPFRSWDPPFDLVLRESKKSESIASLIETIADEFNVPSTLIVPLYTGKEYSYYNISTFLFILQNLLPDAKGAALRRVLPEESRNYRVDTIKRSLLISGTTITRHGFPFLVSRLRRAFDNLSDRSE